MKRVSYFLVFITLIAFLTGCTNIEEKQIQRKPFEAHFMNVGDGDAILIIADGKNMLVDSGDGEHLNNVTGYLSALGINRFDACVATHPHEDHIGNLDNIINKNDIGDFYTTDVTANTRAFLNMMEALKGKSLKVNYLKANQNFTLGDAKVMVLAPLKSGYAEVNDSSAVVKVVYKNKSVLLTGDIQHKAEEDIIDSGQSIKADVLKVAHHGSNTSSTKKFISAVKPDYAVISCAKNSQYNYPSSATVNRLESGGAKVYTTAANGNVVVASDGDNLEVLSER